jgi:hypothetical protein
VSETLLLLGIACVLAAIVGGGLELAKVAKIPAIASVRRQVLLGVAGVVLITVSLMPSDILSSNGQPTPTPTSPTRVPVATPTPGPTTDTFPTLPTRETAISLEKSSGPPGTELTIDGSGFAPGETIVIRFHTRELSRLQADSQGAFAGAAVQVPSDWPFTGQFHFVATGQTSIRSARMPFEVN